MNKLLLILILLASSAMANDSGVFGNPDKLGEGIVVTHGKHSLIHFFFFTHSPLECVTIPAVILKEVEVVPKHDHCTGGQPIWYLTEGEHWNGHEAIGLLYQYTAYDYPFEIDGNLGEEEAVAIFILEKVETSETTFGFRLAITPFGKTPIDPAVHLFSVRMFGADAP